MTLKPMMADREIEYIDNLIKERKLEYCLEWGSGESTIYFPTRHEEIKLWQAVEHQDKWVYFVTKRMNRKNTVIRFKREEDYLNIYGSWDLILVDGILRNECLSRAQELIKKDGIVLLHDSQRRDYDKGVALYKHKEVIFEGIVEGDKSHRGLMKLWI
jgi:hypothetical protein